jgi:hypothetical protein
MHCCHRWPQPLSHRYDTEDTERRDLFQHFDHWLTERWHTLYGHNYTNDTILMSQMSQCLVNVINAIATWWNTQMMSTNINIQVKKSFHWIQRTDRKCLFESSCETTVGLFGDRSRLSLSDSSLLIAHDLSYEPISWTRGSLWRTTNKYRPLKQIALFN